MATRRSRSSPAPSPTRGSACAARACRTCVAGPAVISTYSSTSTSDQAAPSSSAIARGLREGRRGAGRAAACARSSACRSAPASRHPVGCRRELAVERRTSRPASRRSRRTGVEHRRAVATGGDRRAAFELIDEGLGARVGPDSRPAVVRGYVPARDAARAEAAAVEAAEALGHLRAFGLRTIGELRTRIVHEVDWAEAWKAHFPVLRVGRRLVIRPTWRRHRHRPAMSSWRSTRAWPSGRGCTPRPGCACGARALDDRGTLDGTRSSMSVAGRASWPSPPSRSARPRPRGRHDPIAIEATLANARRNRLAPRSTPESAASRAASRRSMSCSPTSSRACSCRSRLPLRAGSGQAARSSPRASSSIARRGHGRLRGGGLVIAERPRRVTGWRRRPDRADGRLQRRPPLQSGRCPPASFRSCSRSTSAWRSACSCPRSCCRSRCARGVRRVGERRRRACCGRSRTARS